MSFGTTSQDNYVCLSGQGSSYSLSSHLRESNGSRGGVAVQQPVSGPGRPLKTEIVSADPDDFTARLSGFTGPARFSQLHRGLFRAKAAPANLAGIAVARINARNLSLQAPPNQDLVTVTAALANGFESEVAGRPRWFAPGTARTHGPNSPFRIKHEDSSVLVIRIPADSLAEARTRLTGSRTEPDSALTACLDSRDLAYTSFLRQAGALWQASRDTDVLAS